MKLSTQPNAANTSGVFAKRLADALKRRLVGGVTVQHLARAIDVSVPTVWSWLNGINEPKGRHVVALIGFFDASFANEILSGTGCKVAKLGDVRRQIAALRSALQAIEDDAELAAIEREEARREQDARHVATEGRRAGLVAGQARQQVVPVLAAGKEPAGETAAAVAKGWRR